MSCWIESAFPLSKLVERASVARFAASVRSFFAMKPRASSIERSKVAWLACCWSSLYLGSFGSISARLATSANAVSASACRLVFRYTMAR